MRVLIVFLAFTGTAFWIYCLCLFARHVGKSLGKMADGLKSASDDIKRSQTTSAEAQARAVESLDRANADLAAQQAKRDAELAGFRRVAAEAQANAERLATLTADADFASRLGIASERDDDASTTTHTC